MQNSWAQHKQRALNLQKYMQVIKGWYAARPSEMQQVMQELAGKPYTIDRSALPKDSRAPAEAQAMARQASAASQQHKRRTVGISLSATSK